MSPSPIRHQNTAPSPIWRQHMSQLPTKYTHTSPLSFILIKYISSSPIRRLNLSNDFIPSKMTHDVTILSNDPILSNNPFINDPWRHHSVKWAMTSPFFQMTHDVTILSNDPWRHHSVKWPMTSHPPTPWRHPPSSPVTSPMTSSPVTSPMTSPPVIPRDVTHDVTPPWRHPRDVTPRDVIPRDVIRLLPLYRASPRLSHLLCKSNCENGSSNAYIISVVCFSASFCK